MQQTLVELEGASGTPTDLPTQTLVGAKPKKSTTRARRLYFSLSQGALILTLMSILFTYGVNAIRQNARALDFFALSFNNPQPFWWIGLWGISMLLLAILSISILRKICTLLTQLLRQTA